MRMQMASGAYYPQPGMSMGMSVGVGVAMGSMAAGIMSYKRLPSVFANSLEIGSIFSYLTYMGTLIATPFRVK